MIDSGGGSPLLIRGRDVTSGELVASSPGNAEMKFISFRVVRMLAGERIEADTGKDEVALVLIAGTVDVLSSAGAWKSIGKRPDPFSGPPEAVYLPPAASYEIRASRDAEVAVCGAPARELHAARIIAPSADAEYTRGDGQAQRRVRNILMDDGDASTLFLTEVVTLPGNWSSYPPHKHDEDNPPVESQLEELYYYRARPAAGFAFQRVYTPGGDLDETITAHDGDVVLVPRGYHVCAGAAGYWIYYLNVLAGPKHTYHMTFDPSHAWIKENWTW
ncbi:MAG TPA: 5-deoxy-glucuronate isomerase [Candidatus Eremiobacteraceae bacterium]